MVRHLRERLGLELNETKTNTVDATEASFDFPGFSIRVRRISAGSTGPALGVEENVFPAVATGSHVVDSAGELDAKRAGHGQTVRCREGVGKRRDPLHGRPSQHYRSSGFKPVCFAIRASIFGPSSSPS